MFFWLEGGCSFQWECVDRCMFEPSYVLRLSGVDEDTAHSRSDLDLDGSRLIWRVTKLLS